MTSQDKSKTLPMKANLEYEKKQAKVLLRDFRSGRAAAVQRIKNYHSKLSEKGGKNKSNLEIKLTDVQLVIAREYGFESWPQLKDRINSIRSLSSSNKIPFKGALEELEGLIKEWYGFVDHLRNAGDPIQKIRKKDVARVLTNKIEATASKILAGLIKADRKTQTSIIKRFFEILNLDQVVATGDHSSHVRDPIESTVIRFIRDHANNHPDLALDIYRDHRSLTPGPSISHIDYLQEDPYRYYTSIRDAAVTTGDFEIASNSSLLILAEIRTSNDHPALDDEIRHLEILKKTEGGEFVKKWGRQRAEERRKSGQINEAIKIEKRISNLEVDRDLISTPSRKKKKAPPIPINITSNGNPVIDGNEIILPENASRMRMAYKLLFELLDTEKESDGIKLIGSDTDPFGDEPKLTPHIIENRIKVFKRLRNMIFPFVKKRSYDVTAEEVMTIKNKRIKFNPATWKKISRS